MEKSINKTKILFTTPVVVTAGVYDKMKSSRSFDSFVAKCLTRHFSGDFGSIPEDEILMNPEAIKNKIDRVFSVYKNDNGFKIYIITDGIPRHTTILFPNEY